MWSFVNSLLHYMKQIMELTSMHLIFEVHFFNQKPVCCSQGGEMHSLDKGSTLSSQRELNLTSLYHC